MKKHKIKTPIIIAGVTIALGGIAGGAVGAYSATAAPTDGWGELSLAESYAYGDKFTVPELSYTSGGSELAATHSVVMPSGAATDRGELVLTEKGRYEINYLVNDNGRVYTQNKYFYVDYPFIECGQGSSVEFGKDKYTAAEDKEYQMPIDKGRETPGLIVKIGKGDTVVFNRLIDIENLTGDDVLLDGFITPETRGAADFTNLTFTFTDSADPSVFMRVNFNQYEDGGSSYVRAAGNGQILSGWNQYKNGSDSEGNKGALEAGNDFGCSTGVSFTSVRKNYRGTFVQAADARDACFALRFDKKTMAISHCPAPGSNYTIIDFDNPDHFTNFWDGFKSNKVRLSVSASGYISDTAKICISEIFGMTQDELKAMPATTFRDAEGPEITLGYDEYSLPKATLGLTYPVMSATAVDAYGGACDVTVRAWHNYVAEGVGTRVNIENGRFKTDALGMYVIEYVARDGFGNASTKRVSVSCVDSVQKIDIEVDAPPSTVKVGERLTVARPTAVNGGSGESDVRVFVKQGETETELDGMYFVPVTTGDYTLIYRATDFCGATGEKSFAVKVEPNDKPVLNAEPELLRYYISGSSYNVPAVTAHDYNANTDEACAVRVTDGKGVKTYRAGEKFVPEAGDGEVDSIKLEFMIGELVLFEKRAELVKVYDTEKINIGGIEIEGTVLKQENFFDAYGTDIKANDSDSVASVTAEESGWTFITPQSVYNLSVVLRKFDFAVGEEVTVTFTDAYNADISVSATLRKTLGGVMLTATGGNYGEIKINMGGNNEFAIAFDGEKFTMGALSVSPIGFGGFQSDLAYISLTAKAAVGRSYAIKSISGNVMLSSMSDSTPPSIYLIGEYGGSYFIDETYTVCAAKASDALFPNLASFTLSVFAPSGEYAKDSDGVELKDVDPERTRYIKLDSYGNYRFVYTAIDENKNEGRLNYVVNVVDRVPPKVVFDTAPPKTAVVGDKIAIPKYTVTDNISAADDITVVRYVINPNGKRIYLDDGNDSLRCAYVGKYEFHILAVDASGNMTDATFIVDVTDKKSK